MPALRLVEPSSVEESIHRARTLNDKYGFRQRLRECPVEDLIARFNRSIGCTAWVSARSAYLMALRDALLATGLDCSSFISDSAMEMDWFVERRGNAIVPVGSC